MITIGSSGLKNNKSQPKSQTNKRVPKTIVELWYLMSNLGDNETFTTSTKYHLNHIKQQFQVTHSTLFWKLYHYEVKNLRF